ncbi:hypothetical protein M407DRAFT_7453 [Tulasnella calospora MUT 4182]|uniref:Uncharacterized protein n=1 Tax=Tulasnella calospora MUT 4182 TaxID=1051891 RepID=A0A0C3QA72_9AGAM|nr:hypothetical protein M407DRAFT_7453 [Tulasnella calospora MUT 4182]
MPPAYVWRGAAPEYSFTKQIDRITPYNGGSVKCVTLDRQDALLFCFRPDAEAYPIACLSPVPARHHRFHPLVATAGVRTASQVSLGSGLWRPPYQMVSKIWNVLEDGTLQATLSDFPEPTQIDRYNELLHGKVEPSNWTTTTVYVDTAGVPISFAKDAVTTSSTHPNTNRPLLKARIVFEPFWSPAADSKTPPV